MKIVSRLRRMPDALKIPKEDGGGVASFVANGVFQGECSSCEIRGPNSKLRPARFWTESRTGALVCPHCGSKSGVSWQWARAQTCFVPEYETQILDNKETKK